MDTPSVIAQRVLDAMAKAWASGDAAGYAATFKDMGTLLHHRSGQTLRGRQRIYEGHAYAFRVTHRNSTLEDCRVISATLVKEGVISVNAVRTVCKGATRNKYNLTLLLEKEEDGGAFLIAHFAAKQQQQGILGLESTTLAVTVTAIVVGVLALGMVGWRKLKIKT